MARRTYDEAVRQALIVLWEAADRICGKRLKPVLPNLVIALERHGHLALDATVRQRILSVSAATIDRLLASVRSNTSYRKKRKTAKKPSKEMPIRTFADYGVPLPGYLEIDFVSHGGSFMQGVFLWSLVATDVCTDWTKTVALMAREQSLVIEGLEVICHQFPVPIKGIDTDNDRNRPPSISEGRGFSQDAIGAASAGLSLVGLLASRARLRFTRLLDRSRRGRHEQGQAPARRASPVLPRCGSALTQPAQPVSTRRKSQIDCWSTEAKTAASLGNISR